MLNKMCRYANKARGPTLGAKYASKEAGSQAPGGAAKNGAWIVGKQLRGWSRLHRESGGLQDGQLRRLAPCVAIQNRFCAEWYHPAEGLTALQQKITLACKNMQR